jgi:hypothetical protein
MNVSAGDHAYIIKSDYPEQVGLPVEVLRIYGDMRYKDIGVQATWEVFTTQRIRVYCLESHTTAWHTPDRRLLVPDIYLRRIAGPSIDIGTETETPLTKTKETETCK